MNILASIIITILLLLLLIIIVSPVVFGAPFYPTERKIIQKLVKFAKENNIKKACDLGSGDGRVVIALARAGIETVGFEINPILVSLSKLSIKRGKSKNAQINFTNFWRVDLSEYDLIFVFGLKNIMNRLERKLRKEMKPGTFVASFAFEFPNWKHKKKMNGVYLYER